MITASNLNFQFGKKILLQNASFMIENGERAAIVGANGTGKTTLLKIIAGESSPDGGDVTLSKGATIGFLPQEGVIDSEITLYEELYEPFLHIKAYQDELSKIEHDLAEVAHDSADWRRLSDRWDFLNSEIHRLEAYNIDSEIKKIADGLGFKMGDLERKCREFSGGWQMRILLAKILLQNPSVLLLDEPTNHLDLETMIWLEEWIASSKNELIMVSHERAFIDKLVTKIIELDRGNLTVYRGNYTSYLEQRKDRIEHQRRAYENQQLEINQIKRFIDKFRANAARAAQVQSRVKQLEKIEPLPPPPSEDDTIHFKFPEPSRSNKEVVIIKNLTKRYGEKTVLENIDYTVYRGEKIALLGVNGAGKSTLMKILAGEDKDYDGEISVGTQAVMEYFSQYQYDTLNPMNDVMNELGSVAPPEFTSELRSLLGAFLFRGDDVFKKVSVLSGGEKTRLKLAKMLYSRANLLLLDEPTNHLDIASRRTLEQSLEKFTGTLVFVSHDRYFIDKIATKVVEIADKKMTIYTGNYSDYIRAKNNLAALAEKAYLESITQVEGAPGIMEDAQGAAGASSAHPQVVRKTKEQKRLEAELRQRISTQRKILEGKVKKIEGEIEASESRLAEIDALLGDSSIYAKPGEAQCLVLEKRELEEKLAGLLQRWEAAQTELKTLIDSIQQS